jgi:hypothetical protein
MQDGAPQIPALYGEPVRKRVRGARMTRPASPSESAVQVELWIPRRAPNLNDLFQAKSTVYGTGKKRTDAYNKLKQDWAATVELCVVRDRRLFTAKGLLGPCAVHFELVEPNKRFDPDNLCGATAKLVLDGLVKAGVLEGDGWAHIAGLSFSWRVGSPAGVRVVLSPAAVTQKEVGMKTSRVNGGANEQ